MEIITNNVPRHITYGYELPASARKDFDWMSDEDFDCAEFVRYKRHWYALSEFMRIEPTTATNVQFAGWNEWDGYSSDSFFSGVLVRFCQDCEAVIVGRYYS